MSANVIDVAITLLMGAFAGFISSMPSAGPASAIAITLSLRGKIKDATLLAAGAAVGESAYSFLAMVGFGAVVEAYPSVIVIAKALSAVICITLGVVFIRMKPTLAKNDTSDSKRAGIYSFLFGLSLTGLNPTLLVTWGGFSALLHGMNLLSSDSPASVFAFGVLLGIFTWMIVLISLLGRFKHKLSDRSLAKAISFVGIVMLVVGSLLMLQLCIDRFTVDDDVTNIDAILENGGTVSNAGMRTIDDMLLD